jgi:hypothetical protein
MGSPYAVLLTTQAFLSSTYPIADISATGQP